MSDSCPHPPPQAAAGEKELLDAIGNDGHALFSAGGRLILLWRSGGRVHYSLQGRVARPAAPHRASAGAFRGWWHEAGSVGDLGQARRLLAAWLFERKEVADLPARQPRSAGIG